MKTLWTAAVLTLFAVAANADDDGRPESRAVAESVDGAEPARRSLRVGTSPHAPYRRALEKRVSFDFVDKPLHEVVDVLAEKADVSILIDDIALEEEGIPLDEPVTHAARNVTIRTAFDRVLESLNLTTIVKADAVVVTSTIVAEELGNLELVIYDVEALVERLDVDRDSVVTKERVYPSAYVHGHVAPGAEDDLIDVIVRLEGPPESWADQGGPGDLTYRDGLLYTRNTAAVHREVDALLAAIDAVSRAEPSDVFVRVRESAEDARIRKVLDVPVSVDFTDKPLVDVIAYFEKTAEVDFVVDIIALEEEGIPLDEPITFEMNEAPLRSVLKHLLEPLNLSWVVKNDSIAITSVVVSEELGNLRVAVADVRPLADGGLDELRDTIIRLTGPPEMWADQGGSGDVTIVGGKILVVRQSMATLDQVEALLAKQHAAHGAKNKARPKRPAADDVLLLEYTLTEAKPEEAIEMIRTFVDPESWEQGTSVVRIVGGQLFIRTTYANHEKIDGLLSKLRSTAPAPFGLGS